MPLEDAEMSSEERDLLLRIAARMPELIDLALRLDADAVAERLASVERCAISLLSVDRDDPPRDG